MDLTRKQIATISHKMTKALKYTLPSRVLRKRGVYFKFIFYMVKEDSKNYPLNFHCDAELGRYIREILEEWEQVRTEGDWISFVSEAFQWDTTAEGHEFWYDKVIAIGDLSQFLTE